MMTFDDVQDRGEQLQALYSGREDLLDAMEDMYFMVWDEQAKIERAIENAKVTISPAARIQIECAIRMITATDPIWRVVDRSGFENNANVADDIERACAMMWDVSGKISGTPIH